MERFLFSCSRGVVAEDSGVSEVCCGCHLQRVEFDVYLQMDVYFCKLDPEPSKVEVPC